MVDALDSKSIARAVELLRRGELVAFPTETVYGLGADAGNAESLQRLYAAKGRPTNHPVIVHLSDPAKVRDWVLEVPPCFDRLAEKLWPGPLTVVLKRAPHVLDQVTGGQDTVAVRVPNHPIALALLRAFGGGLAAPSANKFGRLSPTEAQDVVQEFGSELSLVLDGGPCSVGIESTILDLSGTQPRILRPGMVLRSDIEAAAGITVVDNEVAKPSAEVRVPGSMAAHYAPRTPLLLLADAEVSQIVSQMVAENKRVAVLSFQPASQLNSNVVWRHEPCDPTQFAHDLYHVLRELDQTNSQLIVVEQPPQSPAWTGVRDRLMRAASESKTGA